MYRICLLILGVLFVACSDKNNQSDPEPQGRKIRVDFAVSPSISRTTLDDNYNSAFAIADQIGIFATEGAIANNVKYVVAEGNTLTTSTPITTDGSEKNCNFYAYHPYSDSNGSGSTVNHAVNTDQSTEASFFASDFVTAQVENQVVTQSQAIKLAFKHRMALIELVVNVPEGQDMPIAARLTNCMVQAQWDYKSGEMSSNGEIASVHMLHADKTTGIFRAMVPEQTIDQGTPIFTIETPISTYTFTAQQDIALKSNYVKKFKVGINTPPEESNEFSAEISISSWQIDDEVISGQGVEKPTNYIVQEDFENDVEISLSSYWGKDTQPTHEGWWTGTTKSVNKPQIEVDPLGSGNKIVHLYETNPKAWFDNMLGYVVFNPKPGIYRMRAKIASETKISAPDKRAFEFVMTAAMLTYEDDGYGNIDMIGYIAPGTSPDGSMVADKAPTIDTYTCQEKYILITADIDITQCYRTTKNLSYKLSESPYATTPDMYSMVTFFINGYNMVMEHMYIDSFSIELLEEK